MTFLDLVGPLPLMTTTRPDVTISKYRAGDAPYRRAVQVNDNPPSPPNPTPDHLV